MELQQLITKSHDMREQRKQLSIQIDSLDEEINDLEMQIKKQLDAAGKDYEDLSEEQFQLLMSELGDPKKNTVEVVYVTNQQQVICEVQIPAGATIEDGIQLSGILEKCPEVELANNKVGIYGVIKPLTETLSDGDRVEIYRPVTAKL